MGQGPTGSSDPFALRRSAIGIVNMLDTGLPVSLAAAIDCALEGYAGIDFDAVAARAEIVDFFITRTKVILRDAGNAADVVDAVLAAGIEEPAVIAERTRALAQARSEMPEVLSDLAAAYTRANNLRDEALGLAVDEALTGAEEAALNEAVKAAEGAIPVLLEGGDYPAALRQLANLRGPIDAFFEAVMVMDEDEALKNNRLRLLNRFVSVFASVADFSALAKA